MTEQEKTDSGAELRQQFEKWKYLFYHGGKEIYWTDGDSLNILRDQIIDEKEYLEQEGGNLPEEYRWPLPPEVPRDYMARSRELWYHGIESYKKYVEDENYQYLKKMSETLPKKIKKESCLENVLGDVAAVRHALERRDYVLLRRHEHPERYLESFAECRKRIEGALFWERERLKKQEKTETEKKEENGQINLFQRGMGTSR